MNKVLLFNLKSDLGMFKRPQTNNTPSTFDIIPKSNVLGIILATLGIERKDAKDLYEKFTKQFKYSVHLNSKLNKKYWSEYSYNLNNEFKQKGRQIYSPNNTERLVDIDYNIYILYDDNSEFATIIADFIQMIKLNLSIFPTYSGMANFKNKLMFISESNDPIEKNGEFKTNCFCTKLNYNNYNLNNLKYICYDNIPISNSNYLSYNEYKTINFHYNGEYIDAIGNYFLIENNAIEFI